MFSCDCNLSSLYLATTVSIIAFFFTSPYLLFYYFISVLLFFLGGGGRVVGYRKGLIPFGFKNLHAKKKKMFSLATVTSVETLCCSPQAFKKLCFSSPPPTSPPLPPRYFYRVRNISEHHFARWENRRLRWGASNLNKRTYPEHNSPNEATRISVISLTFGMFSVIAATLYQ